MVTNNPTTKDSREPRVGHQPVFTLTIDYHPLSGDIHIGGNIRDSMAFYGILKLAEKAWDRKLERDRREAATNIKLHTSDELPRPHVPREQ